MKKRIEFLLPAIFALAIFGCASINTESPESVFEISCRDENYVVPEGEIWKLTWESPYKPGDVTPAYDVRVLGKAYTSRNKGTALHAHTSKGGYGLLNIHAERAPAGIWINENTEFYLANDLIKVTVETYSLK